MNGLVGVRGDGKDVLLRVENELVDGSGAVATLQLLNALARVSAKDLDDVAAC